MRAEQSLAMHRRLFHRATMKAHAEHVPQAIAGADGGNGSHGHRRRYVKYLLAQ